MNLLTKYLAPGLDPGLIPASQRPDFARQLEGATGLKIYPGSISCGGGLLFALGRMTSGQKKLLVVGERARSCGFDGTGDEVRLVDGSVDLNLCDLTPGNAKKLRGQLPFLAPRTLGLAKSAGCGDRLGLATPGHIRAARTVEKEGGSGMTLILAQQSMRENERTGRNPQAVLDDALWGIFQEGWDRGYGADADHLKSLDDVELCVAAGYTFYTVDPGDHVDNSADSADEQELMTRARLLPWSELETTFEDLIGRMTSRPVDLGHREVPVSKGETLRAAVKYGRAIAHTVRMYRHLVSCCEKAELPFELEMSVDETATMTTTAEHIYIASELRRLGVKWVSLAPRYLGRFEKGVDYLGEPEQSVAESLRRFRTSFGDHVGVSRSFGNYKLSLHSGSDKFSVYPIVAEEAGELVHLKTAGTSYLEALRTVATAAPALFREIARCAQDHYLEDRASYHVSAELDQMLDPDSLKDEELPELLEDFHGREILHVTFGSVVTDARLRAALVKTLESNEEEHYSAIEKHFVKHFAPFCG